MEDMFHRTGVTEPKLDLGAIRQRAEEYAKVASAAQTASDEILKADDAMMQVNSGPGANAFHARAGWSQGSISRYMSILSDAAKEASGAYAEAADHGEAAQSLMRSTAAVREAEFWRAKDQAGQAAVVMAARTDLLRAESAATSAIQQAFARLDPPNPYIMAGEDRYGRVDPGVHDQWARMDNDRRKKTLQCMADKFAAEHGFPPTQLSYGKLDANVGGQTDLFGKVELNQDMLGDDFMLNSVIHEMEHRYQVKTGFRLPWEDQHSGTSPEEAERWRQLRQEHVEWRGDGRGKKVGEYNDPAIYVPRPSELDARRAAREYINELSLADFQQCAGS